MSDVQYKMVDGELVPLTQDDLDQIDRDKIEPQPTVPPNAMALAMLANSRIDAGIEVGYEAINDVGKEIDAIGRQKRQITVEDVEQQMVHLVDAVRSMIVAQRTVEPPVPPPVTPVTPVTPIQPVATPAPRKKGART